jgi:hypothetical protein
MKMQREIKFRIAYQHEETGRIATRHIELGEAIPSLGGGWAIIGKDQYILQDKNGHDVYESDIVRHFAIDARGVVVWVNVGFSVFRQMDKRYYALHDGWNFIGTRYENSNLLDENADLFHNLSTDQ